MTRLRCLLGALAAAAAAASPADASPLDDPTVERAVFGGTTEPGSLALSLNPATLALGTGVHAHLDLTGDLDRVTLTRRDVDPSTGALSDGASVTSTTASPGGWIGIYKSGDPISVGIQVGLPISERFANGGDATVYQAEGGEQGEWKAVVGTAYRWRDYAFGVSIEFVREALSLRFARDTALENGRNATDGIASDCGGSPCGFENPDAREVYTIDVDDGIFRSRAAVAASFGGVAKIAEGWWLGAIYHSPQGLFSTVETTGTVDVERAPRDGGGHVTGEATVRFALPQRFGLGVRGRLGDHLDLIGEARWDMYSVFDRYDVRLHSLALEAAGIPELIVRPRGLRDDLSLQVGVEEVDQGQRWVLGGRLGVDRGATAPDRLSAQQVYPTALTADVGVQLRIAPTVTVQLGYGVAWSPTRDTGRGAYDPIARLDCIAAGYDIDNPACRTLREGYAIPTASGRYGKIDQVARLSLDWALW